MAARCPGAKNVAEFWSNLRNGVESISFYTEEELRAAGVPNAVLQLPNYIKAAAPLEGMEMFDAEFFNYSPREAEFIDPQQRVFLECANDALEIAGIDPRRFEGAIGVFAGEGPTIYMNLIFRDTSVTAGVARQMALIGNDKDYLATRVSYKLGLRGPSMTVQSACSTSTVAVHLAFQSLMSRECDVALAGGGFLQLAAQVRLPLHRRRHSVEGRAHAAIRCRREWDGFCRWRRCCRPQAARGRHCRRRQYPGHHSGFGRQQRWLA